MIAMPSPGCNDYRAEMQLVALRRRLQNEDLTEAEKSNLRKEIARIEKQMGLD
jgi:hypothetical protein